MADQFFDREAEVSEGSEDEEVRKELKKSRKSKFANNSDDEEEEEDDEVLAQEMKDLINDDEEEEPEESDEEVTGRKRQREDDDDLEEDLEDDDYDLIEENLGRRIERKKKFRRVRRLEDDDEDEERTDGQEVNDREAIANELFDNEEEPNQTPASVRRDRSDREAIDDRFAELSGSERSDDSDEDNFIVDDDDRPIAPRVRKKKSHRFTDEALQQAQDIFGVDFDFEEVQRFDESGDYEEADEEDIDDYEEGDGLNESQQSERSKKSSRKRRSARKSIFEIYEPSELERSHLTKLDNDIRNADIPERFQLRSVPVTSCDEQEIVDESEWVYQNAFSTPTISIQDDTGEGKREPIGGRKPNTAVSKIREALRFIRNEFLEVPFITLYRKEYVEPELSVNDLWIVYKWDEKWCQLQSRKRNMNKLFRNMQTYQTEEIMKDPDAPLPEGIRLINDVDIERVNSVKTFEELRDCWLHFQLYYSSEVPLMKQQMLKKERDRRLEELGAEEDADKILNEEEELINAKLSSIRLAQRKDTYTICKEAGVIGLVAKFGLTPDQFGENLRDNYQRHEVEQYPIDPSEAAQDYICHRFPTVEKVLQAANFMVAKQISCDPIVRKSLRELFFVRAKLHARPTKKGVKEIDENHPCFTMKYLRNKPVLDFGGDQFLQLMIAKSEGLIEFEISIDDLHLPDSNNPQQTHSTYFDEIRQLYHRDEFSINVQQWNAQRASALEIALNKFLYPSFEKELKTKLLNEAHEGIIRQCLKKLSGWLRVAPYQVPSDILIEDDDEFDTRDGIRIMGFSFVPSNDDASFAAIIDGDGEVTDYLKLEYFMLKRTEWATEQEKTLREKDKEKLKKFILQKKPHVIGVGCDTILTKSVVEDIKSLITELNETEQFPQIQVEFVDNEVSTVYMNSKKAMIDFHNYPPYLRQAISLARRLQDPLIEFSQLCTADEEILCIKFHPLQEHLPKDELLNNIYLEFVNRVNDVGVDINRCIVHPHTSQLVQFIGGLGPRKGAYLIRTLKKQQTPLLENRTQLVQNCNIGKIVFINCAGFIKIDTSSLSDSGTDTYIEVLDSTRVHPEAYEWARKMAVDALEYDEDNDTNPAQALEEIIENPEKLKDLDLDAFAEELTRQGMGLKTITLYDIRAELTNRYKDQRIPYRPPNLEEVFQMLTKETHDSFYIGKLVMGQVVSVARRKPQSDQLDQANPVRNDLTSLWKCPFCNKSDFPELSEVWNHFDAGSCPGQAIGIRVRLDNGLVGMVPTRFISDKEVTDPLERVKMGMTIHCRVIKIIVEKFAVDLTCRTSDLMDRNFEFRPPKDFYYCYEAEDKDTKTEEDHKKKQNRQTYIKRIIVHPSFHNIDFKQAEKMLLSMDQGEALIRPSSKANDHLTLTWKVHEGINQHIDIREEGKDNAFSLGHQLYINNESYEDLDEIIARYVQPMASYARDIISYKYFKDVNGKRDEMERLVREEKQKAPSRIPYFVSASKEFPGKFLLSYQPNMKVFHEFISVTPDGFRYRMNTFRSLVSLFKWFKTHFNDRSTFPRTPVATPVMRTPVVATPIDPQAVQRAAASMPTHMFNTLSQVAGQTPSFGGAAAAFGNSHNSMAPPFGQSRGYYPQSGATTTPMQSMMTPNMTTPRNYLPTTPGSMPPPSHIPSHQRPGSRTGAQWSHMALAENQYNKKPKPRTPLYATPGASSQMSISPNATTPNVRGDQTPLVDEWN